MPNFIASIGTVAGFVLQFLDALQYLFACQDSSLREQL